MTSQKPQRAIRSGSFLQDPHLGRLQRPGFRRPKDWGHDRRPWILHTGTCSILLHFEVLDVVYSVRGVGEFDDLREGLQQRLRRYQALGQRQGPCQSRLPFSLLLRSWLLELEPHGFGLVLRVCSAVHGPPNEPLAEPSARRPALVVGGSEDITCLTAVMALELSGVDCLSTIVALSICASSSPPN